MKSLYKFIIIVGAIGIGFLAGWYIYPNFHKSPQYNSNSATELSKDDIRHYLENTVATAFHSNLTGKFVCDYADIGSQTAGRLTENYIWAFCQEYKSSFEKGEGFSGPVAIISTYENNQPVIITYNRPGDGNLYSK